MPAIDPPEDLEPISTVTFAKPRPGDLPYYVMPDTALSHGASFGNKQMWLTSKASGAIHRLFSLELGTDVFGPVVVTYAVPGERPLRLVTTDSSGDEPDVEFTIVHQDGPGVVEVHPMRQHHRMRLSGELRVEEAILLPKTGGDEPSVAVYRVEVTNEAELERAVRVSAYASLQGQTPADIAADYDPKLGALVACNQSQPDWVRIFGSATAPETYETTHDVSQVYGDGRARCLSNDTSATGAVLGALQIDLCLAPGQTKSLSFALAFSAHGEQAARELYLANRDFDGALEKTRAYITPTLSVAMVETPDPVVNEGVFWAKVNMLRVMGDYPKGPAFTNEPGVSSNVVGRDVVWYVYGCDYMMPEFSAQLLRGLARCQYPNGKMVEYYNAITDDRADYGLNVNDDTPLFVLGIHHHFLATGDKDFLRDLYPAAQRAALYFLSQRDERGLVYCSAEGTNVEGIASWRNVIPNYQINGAVTEVNAECHGALRALAEMAGALGKQDRANEFTAEADALRGAMNRHLLSPTSRMYYLNIDTDGAVHTDVTADEIFPIMFGVADSETSYTIISRLDGPDFNTSAGLRTVSRASPHYEPMKNVGLMGGVWPGLTFWYAFAAASYQPGIMAKALHSSYAHYQRDPLRNNTVPGQFSEWFDGESLVNHGMRLSPWEPPRLLWAAVEGACGISGTGDGCRCRPVIPPNWQWIGLRRLPHCGKLVSFFAARQRDGLHIYSNVPLITDHPLDVYAHDGTNKVQVLDHRVHRLALRGDDGSWLICLGSSAAGTVTVPLRLDGVLADDESYAVELYSSQLSDWQHSDPRPGSHLAELAVTIEAGGFRLLRIMKA
jgi:glycogen debranching enzyme